MEQHPFPRSFSNVNSAALVAASNTSSTPSPVKLLHSRYFLAPTCFAIVSAYPVCTKCMDFLRISSRATGSSRRSFLRPTNIMGTPGQRSCASSIHCARRQLGGRRYKLWRRLTYFVGNVLQRVRGIDRISYQNDVGFSIS